MNDITKKKEHFVNELWVEILTQNKIENIKNFQKILNQCNNIIGRAIINYRSQLYKQGRGKISYIAIQEAYNKNDKEKLKTLLQELFLEYIDKDKLEIIINILKEKNKTMKDLYELHMQQPERRIFRIVQQL